MRKFLESFLTPEQLQVVLDAYSAKNNGETTLPVYIPKSRLDEEINKRKEVETKFTAIPADWQDQLKGAQDALATQKTEFEKQLAEKDATLTLTEKLYGAGARNVKAVRALIDPSKPLDEEITRVKTSDPYLFSRSGMNKGTGKGDDEHGGEGDDNGKKDGVSLDKMYAAVGITRPTEG